MAKNISFQVGQVRAVWDHAPAALTFMLHYSGDRTAYDRAPTRPDTPRDGTRATLTTAKVVYLLSASIPRIWGKQNPVRWILRVIWRTMCQ